MRIELLASGSRSDPRVVTGTVAAVADDGPGVRSSRLHRDGGRAYEIAIARDVDYGFDLTHLHEHQVTRDALVVHLEGRDGRLVALSIEDA